MAISTVVTQVLRHIATICLPLQGTQHFVPLSLHPDLYSPNISTHGIAIAILLLLLLLLLLQYFYLSCAPFVATDTVVYNKTEAFFPLLHISHPIPVAARSAAWSLRPLACWDCGFESHRGHGYLWVMCFVRNRSVRWVDPSSRGVLPTVWVSLSVMRCNNNPLHLQWISGRGQNERELKKEIVLI